MKLFVILAIIFHQNSPFPQFNGFLWDAQQFGVDLGLTSYNKNGAHATGDAGQPASLTDVRDTYWHLKAEEKFTMR